MQKRLPHPINHTDHTTVKPTPRYNLQPIKLASLPFATHKERDFSLRVTGRIEPYNPLKDRFLQQFFRRDSRVKLLSLLASNDASLENKSEIQRITEHAKDKAKSAYQNIVPKPYLSKPYLLKHRFQKEPQKNEPQPTPQKSRLITEPQLSSSKRRGIQVSKEQFRNFLIKARERLRTNALGKA